MKDFLLVLTFIALVAFCVVGYFSNIYKAVNCDWESPYKCEAIHTVGAFIPVVGVFTGYINIEDGEND